MSDILIVIDMQNDFISGTLGTPEAASITENVKKLAEQRLSHGDKLFFTRDTHDDSYMNTQEGRMLPVAHCAAGTRGWEIADSLSDCASAAEIIDKPTFGSFALADAIRPHVKADTVIRLAGICTDICVVSNALIIKTAFPENRMVVYADCCAGVTPKRHEAAIETMAACQVCVENIL